MRNRLQLPQVARLLGIGCERINLSASTTLQQLLGGVMPRIDPATGARVFSWQDGKLLAALRSGRWLLLDEINLAPPEVLDGLAPLLDRCAGAGFVYAAGSQLLFKCRNMLAGAALPVLRTSGRVHAQCTCCTGRLVTPMSGAHRPGDRRWQGLGQAAGYGCFPVPHGGGLACAMGWSHCRQQSNATFFLCILHFRRSATTFTLPATGEKVPLEGVRVFATMNPASIGGGRGQLPRSIAGLFSHVRLEAPSPQELSLIVLSVFSGCLGKGLVCADHVSSIFNFHTEVLAEMTRGQLARRSSGTMQPFNLRDLIKVCIGVRVWSVAVNAICWGSVILYISVTQQDTGIQQDNRLGYGRLPVLPVALPPTRERTVAVTHSARKLKTCVLQPDFHCTTKQVRDILARIMRDQLTHHRFSTTAVSQPVEPQPLAGDAGDDSHSVYVRSAAHDYAAEEQHLDMADFARIRVATLQRVLEIVYVSAFSDAADQASVRALVSRHLGVQPDSADPAAADLDVDVSAPGLLRVGSIYMPRGG